MRNGVDGGGFEGGEIGDEGGGSWEGEEVMGKFDETKLSS